MKIIELLFVYYGILLSSLLLEISTAQPPLQNGESHTTSYALLVANVPRE